MTDLQKQTVPIAFQVVITDTTKTKHNYLLEIQFCDRKETHYMEKTFEDFLKLNKLFHEKFHDNKIKIPNFPLRSPSFLLMIDSFALNRKNGLQNYMNEILQIDELKNSESLEKFLCLHQCYKLQFIFDSQNNAMVENNRIEGESNDQNNEGNEGNNGGETTNNNTTTTSDKNTTIQHHLFSQHNEKMWNEEEIESYAKELQQCYDGLQCNNNNYPNHITVDHPNHDGHFLMRAHSVETWDEEEKNKREHELRQAYDALKKDILNNTQNSLIENSVRQRRYSLINKNNFKNWNEEDVNSYEHELQQAYNELRDDINNYSNNLAVGDPNKPLPV